MNLNMYLKGQARPPSGTSTLVDVDDAIDSRTDYDSLVDQDMLFQCRMQWAIERGLEIAPGVGVFVDTRPMSKLAKFYPAPRASGFSSPAGAMAEHGSKGYD